MGARASERLRQERETFDQLKSHDRCWFRLRLAAATILIAALIAVLVVAAHVVLSPASYSSGAVVLAAVLLLADIACLAGGVCLVVVRDGQSRLSPTTKGG
ncbi:MAG TPA: hypothetical protein VFW35_03160 [Sphingomicrobium sp.]|nr:hypothetical protein [Sphingomicrobium sp.]